MKSLGVLKPEQWRWTVEVEVKVAVKAKGGGEHEGEREQLGGGEIESGGDSARWR